MSNDGGVHPVGWQARYPTDASSRRAKARKILGVLAEHIDLVGADIVEIGAGSGHMTSVFMEAVGKQGSVTSLDVVDMRVEKAGNEFRLIDRGGIPLDRSTADVVISNHVIEHVGNHEDQHLHLSETARILRPDGVGYLSTPNRWAPVENHFRLPFLGWIPRRWRDTYVRSTRRGEVFDVLPLSPHDLDLLCAAASLESMDVASEALDQTIVTEPASKVAKLLTLFPLHRALPLGRVMPTQIRILRHSIT